MWIDFFVGDSILKYFCNSKQEQIRHMKKCLLLFFLVLSLNVNGQSNNKGQIYIEHTSQSDNHDLHIINDEPCIEYDNVSQTITITGTGDVGYYRVKIYYENDMLHPYSITVNGSFATIDVSSFQEGYYTIFIFTPLRNTYVKNIYIYYDKKTPHFGFGDWGLDVRVKSWDKADNTRNHL